MPRRRPAGCPSSLQLDELRAGDLAGEEEAALRDHLAECAVCRERAAVRAADPILSPGPAILRQVTAEAAQARTRVHPGTRGRRWLGMAGAAAGAAAAFLIVWGLAGGGARETADGRTKGTLALTVHVKRAGASAGASIDQVNAEGHLQSGDEFRFTLMAARPGYAVVLGLDAAPSVTIYAPPAGATARAARVESAGMVTLPGSVVADDTAGFERVVAVECDKETPPEALRRQAEIALALANGRPERVLSLRTGCLETSVLFRKEPR